MVDRKQFNLYIYTVTSHIFPNYSGIEGKEGQSADCWVMRKEISPWADLVLFQYVAFMNVSRAHSNVLNLPGIIHSWQKSNNL